MGVTKNQVFAGLAATILVAAYFLFPIVIRPRLEFRDRIFPQGFRDLVLDSFFIAVRSPFWAAAGAATGC